MSQLSGQDALFLHIDSSSVKSHFTIVCIYDQSTVARGVLRYREVIEYFDRLLSPMPVFRRKLHHVPLQLDSPYWVDDPNFHIEAHIRHVALPEPWDWRQFCILASQIQAAPMDMGKPLWDMHIVGGLDNLEGVPEGSFALLTRLHHAVADSDTARAILMSMNLPENAQVRLPRQAQSGELPPLQVVAARALLNNTRQIVDLQTRALRLLPGVGGVLSRVAGNTLDALWPTRRQPVEPSRLRVPETPFNAPLDYRRVFQMCTFPLEKVIAMKACVPGATVNDVVLTFIGEAARLYLQSVGALPRETLVSSFPINLRSEKPGGESVQGKNISIAQASLFTNEKDLRGRLEKISASTRASRETKRASTARELIAMSSEAPNLMLLVASKIALQVGLERGNRRMANINVTNVPGPRVPLYFMGARLLTFTGMAPSLPSNGVNFVVTSYCEDLTVSFTACPGWVEQPQVLADCLVEGFSAMCAALL